MLDRQRAICEKYGLSETAPEDRVAVATRSIGKMPVYGTRVALAAGDNVGGFFHCGEHSSDDDFYAPLHTEHVHDLLPLVSRFLRLPPGTQFIVDDQGYEDVWTSHGEIDEQ